MFTSCGMREETYHKIKHLALGLISKRSSGGKKETVHFLCSLIMTVLSQEYKANRDLTAVFHFSFQIKQNTAIQIMPTLILVLFQDYLKTSEQFDTGCPVHQFIHLANTHQYLLFARHSE